jgi:hypothetical protein
MSNGGDTPNAKARLRVCHRCGWRASLIKVRRRDRRLLGIGRSFGRLCNECEDELLNRRSAPEVARAQRPTSKG